MFSLIFTSYQALTNQCVWIYIYVVSYHFYFVPSSQCSLSYYIFMSSLCYMSILSIIFHVCMHTKSLQSCMNLSDPKNSSLPGCSVHEILQARMLKWDLFHSRIELASPAVPSLQANALPLSYWGSLYFKYEIKQIKI